jgi:hypothetical protein
VAREAIGDRSSIGKQHSQDFVVGVRLEPFDASVSVRQSGRSANHEDATGHVNVCGRSSRHTFGRHLLLEQDVGGPRGHIDVLLAAGSIEGVAVG